MSKRNLIIKVVAAVIIVSSAVAGIYFYQNQSNNSAIDTGHGNMTASMTNPSYSLDLMSGKTYTTNQPAILRFDIKRDGQLFKNFAVDSTKLMHLVVVRKDRNYFQHVHPEYDAKTGTFTLGDFQFPTDGQYRIFANFAPTDAKKDMMGMVETEAPYVDVSVGDVGRVSYDAMGSDSLTNSANGLTASITNMPGGDDASVVPTTPKFYAGVDGTVTVGITKDGVPFKNLQEYLGNLGHMVILGPNMEFIHAHPTSNDLKYQLGYINFMVTFPVSGQYKLYLQTQANDAVSTFNFNVTVRDMPKSSGSGDSMQGMNR